MSNMNHSRPHLKNVDNYKREIAEMDSQYKPDRVINSKTASKMTSSMTRKRPVSSADRAIHVRACEVLAHMTKHNECSLCNKLINSLSGARKAAMIEWFCEFGKLSPVDPKTGKTGIELFFDKKREYRLHEAVEKPFWEFMPDINVKPINFRDEVLKLIEIAEKYLAGEGVRPIENIDPILLGRLKNLLK